MDLNLLDEIRNRVGLLHLRTPALVGLLVIGLIVGGLLVSNVFQATNARAVQISSSQSSEPHEDSQEASSIYVHVSGCVANPGVYKLAAGARVSDAVQAAGGFSAQASEDALNLARVIQDGEQVRIPSTEELSSQQSTESEQSPLVTPQTNGTSSEQVNINTADAAQLIALPGVGESTASKIIADRNSNGPFKSIEDLKRVSGIGDKKFESLRDLICV